MRRARRSSVTPMPSSWTDSMTSPDSRSQPETSTGRSGGENEVAFSMSSASRWERSSAAKPATCACGGQGRDADPLVALDLADRRPDHVDQRHRAGVLLDVLGAGEDQQVLAVPAHHRGEVVELEEGGQAVGVLLALLQALDDRQLALDQAEGAQREVDEGGADAGAQPLQLGGGVGELGAEFLAGVGHLLALAHQVLAVGLQGGDPLVQGHRVRVQGVDRADHLGELVVAARERDRFLGRGVLRTRRGGPSRGAAPTAGGSGCGPWRWRCRSRPAAARRGRRRGSPAR